MQAPCPCFRDFSGAETKNRPMSSRSRTDAASCREECAPPWRCGVVILNYNGSQDTIACLESLLRGSTLPSWVVIVDNASTDGSPEHLQQWAASATGQRMPEVGEAAPAPPPGSLVLLRARQNRGYAAGNNLALRLLMAWGADAVWLLNNDVVVDANALGAMLRRLFAKPRPGLCGARVYYMGTDRVQCRAGGSVSQWTALATLDGYGFSTRRALDESAEVVEARLDFIYGASVMASRNFVQTVGLMDERYFLYCEEQDWAYSARGRFDLAYAADAVVWHKEGGSTGHSWRQVNARALLLLARSRILLTWKHKPQALPTVCLSIVFAAARMAWRRLVSRPVRF